MKDKANDHSKYPHWIDPATVTPYEKNAKIHTEKQIDNICTSIRRFGWQQDIVFASSKATRRRQKSASGKLKYRI